jgi:AcrR family transcriptional regulator
MAIAEEMPTDDDGGGKTAAGETTRLRLILAGERLIAERGLDSVSVRDITGAANVNSASIHYHFRSKEGLVRAILAYRAEAMRAHRLRHVHALEQVSELTAADIARAIVRPTFEFVASEDGEGPTPHVAFTAALIEQPSMAPLIEEYFDDQFLVYAHLLQRLRPELPYHVLINRLSFAFHLVLNSVSRPPRGLRMWIERHHPPALDSLEDDLVGFITGGFVAEADLEA